MSGSHPGFPEVREGGTLYERGSEGSILKASYLSFISVLG